MAAIGSEFVTISQLKTSIDSIDTSSSPIDAYPVGSIYMSAKSTSPATLFGGSWTRIQDRFLIAAGSTYKAGGTGGEATHTLSIDEMPSHDHSMKFNNGDYSGSGYYIGLVGLSNQWIDSTSKTSNSTGGGQAHNNMPPYLSVYVWKRTA